MTSTESVPTWHLHHDVLLSWATPTEFRSRRRAIRNQKPEHERALRLRLMKRVRHPERIPAEIHRAWAAFRRAQGIGDRAWADLSRACIRARTAHPRAIDGAKAALPGAGAALLAAWAGASRASATYSCILAKHRPTILALHAEQCRNCPWDGQTIFPLLATR